jgi:hypothetical protein
LEPHLPSPQHSRPGRPPYWVSPRHLAGDDHALADHVAAAISPAGWASWPTIGDTVVYVSPDGLTGAEWTLAARPFDLGGLPVAWRVAARTHPDATLTQWNAYFTPGVPHEAVTDFVLALDTHSEPAADFEYPETVLVSLAAQGWLRDIDTPGTTASAPGSTATFALCLLPPLIDDAGLDPDPVGWQAWAEPEPGGPYLWCATFSASVPHSLVAAFASSLASPAPVLRRVLPDIGRRHLTVTWAG